MVPVLGLKCKLPDTDVGGQAAAASSPSRFIIHDATRIEGDVKTFLVGDHSYYLSKSLSKIGKALTGPRSLNLDEL